MKRKICFLSLIFILLTFVGCSYVDLSDTTRFKKEEVNTEYTVVDADSYLDPDLFTIATIVVDIGNENTYKIRLSNPKYNKFVRKFGNVNHLIGKKIPVVHTKYYNISTGKLYTETVQVILD